MEKVYKRDEDGLVNSKDWDRYPAWTTAADGVPAREAVAGMLSGTPAADGFMKPEDWEPYAMERSDWTPQLTQTGTAHELRDAIFKMLAELQKSGTSCDHPAVMIGVEALSKPGNLR